MTGDLTYGDLDLKFSGKLRKSNLNSYAKNGEAARRRFVAIAKNLRVCVFKHSPPPRWARVKLLAHPKSIHKRDHVLTFSESRLQVTMGRGSPSTTQRSTASEPSGAATSGETSTIRARGSGRRHRHRRSDMEKGHSQRVLRDTPPLSGPAGSDRHHRHRRSDMERGRSQRVLRGHTSTIRARGSDRHHRHRR